jgi:ribosomal-protein-alanine N-acetyltransferase
MIRIRTGSIADLPGFIEIARHSATAAQWEQNQYEMLFTPQTTGVRVVLVIEEEGQVMGFIVGRAAAGEWEIENIAVAGSARRRGLASRLLGQFLNLVRERGGHQVFLEVRESNHAARQLYEKWAFTETGRRKAYYQNPAEDALVFSISFPQPG